MKQNVNEIKQNVNKTDIYKFKVKDNISWYNFCLKVYQAILQKINKVICL